MAARQAGRRLAPGKLRLVVLGTFLVLAWLGMGYRLVQVQVVQAAELRERGLEQRLVERPLPADRGRIYDRNGDLLAMAVDAETIYAVPGLVTEPLYVAQQIGGLLGVDPDELLGRLESDRDFVYVKRQVDLDQAAQVREMNLAGIFFEPETTRVYPAGPVAAHVVGFVDIDGRGLEGLELQYDALLSGTPGSQIFEKAPSGTPIPQGRREEVPAVPGSDLVSTIDLPLQYSTQDACVAALERTGAKGCWAVVLEVETGNVLAMAGAPVFDPVARTTVDGEVFANAVVREPYEPGSIQKLITVSAAIEEGVVDVDSVFGAVGDEIELRPGACESEIDQVYGCYADFEEHETHDMTVREIFTASSNVGIIRIAQKLPEGMLVDYIEHFGLTEPTGIDYAAETSGLLNMPAGCTICPLSAAIGYSIAASPLQMASAYAAIGNDGTWIQPRLVSTTIDVDGPTDTPEQATREVVTPETARIMRELLAGVVESGTGGRANVDGYRVGGKTGTADKLGEDGTYTDVTRASFVGLAPIDDPKLVVAVMVDEPTWDFRTGGQAAAPVFAEIMEQGLHRLGVTPDGLDG
ncbi:MAG TPA: penicillin-binding protein 2 [Acidimicrobiia bacterium]|nr:penicillin-binding protein 2 [Acidimicrobiia bacterium]